MSTLSKSTKVFFNVQGAHHSLNEAPTMAYAQDFSSVPLQPPTPPTERTALWVGPWEPPSLPTRAVIRLHRYNGPQILFSI